MLARFGYGAPMDMPDFRNMSNDQKIKLGLAAGLLVLGIALLGWNLGWFSGPVNDPSKALAPEPGARPIPQTGGTRGGWSQDAGTQAPPQ